MFALVSFASTLSVMTCGTLFVLQLGPLDACIVSQTSCIHMGDLSLHTLSSVFLAVLCVASVAKLGYLLALQRIYIFSSLSLFLILTVNTSHLIFDWLYVFNMTELFFFCDA